MTRPTSRAGVLRARALPVLWLAASIAAAWLLAGVFGGHPTVHLNLLDRVGDALHTRPARPWFTGLPAQRTGWIGCSVAAAVALAVLLARAAARLRPADPRAAAVPGWPRIRRIASQRVTRAAGAWTRPDSTRWNRLPGSVWPTTAFGYPLGRLGRHRMWLTFEYRCRIIARTGWGKTTRLLIPIARDLPGPALLGSTAADLFTGTVTARARIGPVRVIDFSERAHRYAAGYPAFTWNPIGGCADYALALRRARALVAGAQPGADNEDNTYFRLAAIQVTAAWLHAADLGRLPMDTLLRWQADIHAAEPRDIIDLHTAAEPVAKAAMLKHLDERAARTTSNTERFLQLALAPFATRDGAAFCSPTPGCPTLPELIATAGTLYLLASPSTAAQVSPLLTLVADEWFYTARSLALAQPGQRLNVPAVGCLDELRALVPIPSLPEVVYEMRKYGIGVLYALQNAAQERELYGDAAESLAANVQATVVGGYDPSIAEELSAQSGQVEVPVLTGRGLGIQHDFSESGTWRPVITPADMADLPDGRAVVRLAGVRPFYATFPRPPRRARRTQAREARAVTATVTAARATATATRAAFDELAAATWRTR